MNEATIARWRALVDARATLTAVQGVGSRFHQVVSPRGAARRPRWRALAVLGGVLDLAKARTLARDDRFRLIPRLLWDAGDLALWCLCAGDDADSSEDAVIPGASLAVEAGARMGLGGLCVPAANAGVAALVRRARGHQLRLGQFSWQLMGVGSGWALSILAGRRHKRLHAVHCHDLAARTRQAELAGFHDVVVDRNGAIDVLQRATALIDLGVPGRRAHRQDLTGALKATVAQSVRDRETYLRDVLTVWQESHNLQPDLTRLVRVSLDPAEGTVILSAEQASTLQHWLGRRELTGVVVVRLADPARARVPFERRDLWIDGELVELAAPVPLRRWAFEAVPAAMLLNIGWLVQPTGRHREAVAWSATLPSMALTILVAAWSAWRGEHGGAVDPRKAVAASFAVTMLYTLSSTRAMRSPHTATGVSRFPWVMPLQGYELVRGVVSARLGKRWRAAGLAGTAAVISTGWALSPPPRSPRALVAELGWVAGFDLFARRLRRSIAEAAHATAEQFDADASVAVTKAHRRGRDEALVIVWSALSEARASLRAAREALPADVHEEAARRLDRVEAMLRAQSSDLDGGDRSEIAIRAVPTQS